MRTERGLRWAWVVAMTMGLGWVCAPGLSHACDRSCPAGAPRDANGCCVGTAKAKPNRPVSAKPKRRAVARPDGTEGGKCYGNGTCNVGLVCEAGRCLGLPDGTAGGKCYGNGTCNAGLDCADGRCVEPAAAAGIEWVRIAGGSFRMGSESGENDEKPVRVVRVGDFALSKTEVTVGQYRACVRAGACTAPSTGGPCNWNKSGRDDHPINCVDWNQASAFAKWAGGRLPSEAEWEYAARSGGRDQTYAWGNAEADCSRAVMNDGSGTGCGQGTTTFPVCSKPAGNTSQGLCDMAGNVWEWVADWYGPYGEAPNDGSARTRTALYRVSRGGSWLDTAGGLRAANRYRFSPGFRFNFLGFRVARATP